MITQPILELSACDHYQVTLIRVRGLGEPTMPLTRDFKETIRVRVQRDPKFRKELLREGLEAMLSGETARSPRQFCATTSTQPSASLVSPRSLISRRKASWACSDQPETQA